MSRYLQLLEVFAIREIKSRYKSSILGFLWIVIFPLATAIILSLIFGTFIRISTEGVPYFLFLLSGLLYWNFFQQGFILAKDALIWNRDLVVKTAFPKVTLPLSYVLSRVPDFFVSFLILLIFYLIYGYNLNINFILIILFILPILLFLAGISLIISSLNAVFRDFGRIVDLFMTLLFYATPIIYPDTAIPHQYKLFVLLNPISDAIIFTRDLLFKNNIRYDLFFLSLILSLPIFAFGMIFFIKMEKKIVDLI
jgi:lipopolysaccharide transport system permease protein